MSDQIPAPGWQLARLRDVPEGAEYRTSDASGLDQHTLVTHDTFYASALGHIVEWRMPPDLVTVQVEREVAQEFVLYAEDNCLKSKPRFFFAVYSAFKERLEK